MINIENWIPKYIFGYLLYFSFISVIVAYAPIGANVYDVTPEQQEILSTPAGDIFTFLERVVVLSSISSGFVVISIITALLGLVFLLAVFKALKEIIPVLPS